MLYLSIALVTCAGLAFAAFRMWLRSKMPSILAFDAMALENMDKRIKAIEAATSTHADKLSTLMLAQALRTQRKETRD